MSDKGAVRLWYRHWAVHIRQTSGLGRPNCNAIHFIFFPLLTTETQSPNNLYLLDQLLEAASVSQEF